LGITDALFLREKRPSISAWAMAMRIQHALKVVVALAMGLIPTVAHGILNKKFGKHYHGPVRGLAHVWLNPIDH